MGSSMRISSSFLFILSLCCIFHSSFASIKKQQLKSAVIVGTVYCDTCFQNDFSKSSHFIPGASVAIECGSVGTTKPSFQKEVRTNRHGVFRLRLPPKVAKHVDTIQSCSVTLIRSSEPFCAVASSATSAGLRLKSRRNGHHVFSAGYFTFKPLNQPELCYQEPKTKSNSLTERKPIGLQLGFFFPPPIPFLPSPPNIGGIPLPPNPLLPPPSLVPPIFPSPPPSILPPVFPSPPPSIFPPMPFFTPSPPPPSFPFPPLPFPPLFPGHPPASPSTETSP